VVDHAELIAVRVAHDNDAAGSGRAGAPGAELYADARRRGVKGRSSMTKAQLALALDR
jgi:hypothetical protein